MKQELINELYLLNQISKDVNSESIEGKNLQEFVYKLIYNNLYNWYDCEIELSENFTDEDYWSDKWNEMDKKYGPYMWHPNLRKEYSLGDRKYRC